MMSVPREEPELRWLVNKGVHQRTRKRHDGADQAPGRRCESLLGPTCQAAEQPLRLVRGRECLLQRCLTDLFSGPLARHEQVAVDDHAERNVSAEQASALWEASPVLALCQQ